MGCAYCALPRTNTSNPSVMLGRSPAKKAVERGLTLECGSALAPAPRGDRVLREMGLQPYLNELGFNLWATVARPVLEIPDRLFCD